MSEANDSTPRRRRVPAGVRVVFDGAAGKLVGDRWAPVGERRGPALLLHGGGQTRHSWFRTAAALADAGWDAVALDARGHGDSDWAPDGDYGTDALDADLLAVIEQVGEPALLVGASMGGMTALVAEGEHGGLARALVLVDIVPRVEADGVARIMAFMGANPDGFASLDEVAEAVRAYNPHRKRPPNPEGLRKNVRLRENGRWYWHWDPAFLRVGDEPRRSTTHERAAAAAARVAVPTLLVRGAQSDIVSEDGVRELLELIPGSVHVDVSATGHMVAGDDNDVFTRTVLDFLQEKRVSPRRP
ncbi:alpha/beta hydrolase [Pseudonocardia yuanmonensis]|uniref:alpha/beta fold hydrolase n=1 Tax=Pseudonocardia yuanmonensis TaxID=1095914 RepID=UPI0031EEF188